MLFVPCVSLVVIYHLTMCFILAFQPRIVFCFVGFIFLFSIIQNDSQVICCVSSGMWCHVHCAFLYLTMHYYASLCAQSPNPKKENSREIFKNQGKCLVISGTSDCALYFCYYVCAEILTKAVKETILWYFCSLDSWVFLFMKCI